ncbi:fibrous sheath CABYR-binding protein-like [Antennarius striatus]|uniref:fibrous sheath CABYR-binding protein-like n=1 Tax=Antennarius striatus TaxID=241820 RepID=UPI0035B446CF
MGRRQKPNPLHPYIPALEGEVDERPAADKEEMAAEAPILIQNNGCEKSHLKTAADCMSEWTRQCSFYHSFFGQAVTRPGETQVSVILKQAMYQLHKGEGDKRTDPESPFIESLFTVSPPPEAWVPPAEEVVPPAEDAPPPAEEAIPQTEEVPPPAEEAPPPAEEAPPPAGEEAPPAEEGAPPAEEEAPPAEEAPPPAEEETPPAEEEAPPAEEEAPPAEEEAPPAEEEETNPQSLETFINIKINDNQVRLKE